MREAIRVRNKAHARYTSSKTTTGWEEYPIARNKVEEIVEEKKGEWKNVVNKTEEYFGGGMEQMWVGIKGILSKRAGETDTVIATLRTQHGKMDSTRGRGK